MRREDKRGLSRKQGLTRTLQSPGGTIPGRFPKRKISLLKKAVRGKKKAKYVKKIKGEFP